MKRFSLLVTLFAVGAAVFAAENRLMLWPRKVEGDFQPFLELYLLEKAPEAPAGLVLICPGGGYARRAKHEGEPIAKVFNELGWHAAVLQYRTAPSVYPAPQQDALRAIRLVRAHAAKWKVKPDNIAVLGFSAGGHLAASCGTLWNGINADAGDAADRESARPDAMILCYPVINVSTGHRGSGRRLLGAKEPDKEKLAKLDLETRVTADTPPAFLWHAAYDRVVPVWNSIRFAEAMWAHKRTAELHIFPRGSHGISWGAKLDKIPEVRIWPTLADRFLKMAFRAR